MDNKIFFTKENIKISDKEYEKFLTYKDLLIEWNKKINLTAILEEKEIIYKHFIDSLLLLKIPELSFNEKSIIDVGTGAGFPGLPLAITNKKLQVTLSDSLKKRIEFLKEVVRTLDIDNVTFLEGRAEDLGKDRKYREKYDFSVARAVSKLPVLLEYTLPFVKVGGFFIAYKGPDYILELEESKKALQELGGEVFSVKKIVIEEMNIERNIILIKKVFETPEKYPRRAGIPLKRPI